MSCCTVHLFKDNEIWDSKEFSNSWGGAAYIWSVLFDKYLKESEFDNWMMGTGPDRLWALVNDPRLSFYEKVVLYFTFDYAIVRQENIHRLVPCLRQFHQHYANPEKICHLAAWADYIEENTAEVQAVGMYLTSVSEDLWNVWDEERGEYFSYNLERDKKHYDIFNRLEPMP